MTGIAPQILPTGLSRAERRRPGAGRSASPSSRTTARGSASLGTTSRRCLRKRRSCCRWTCRTRSAAAPRRSSSFFTVSPPTPRPWIMASRTSSSTPPNGRPSGRRSTRSPSATSTGCDREAVARYREMIRADQRIADEERAERQAEKAASILPWRPPGRQTKEGQARYEADLKAFCDRILKIRDKSSIEVSLPRLVLLARGARAEEGRLRCRPDAHQRLPEVRHVAARYLRRRQQAAGRELGAARRFVRR